MWQLLGLSSVIDEAAGVDRAGSVVLEYLLRRENGDTPGVEFIGSRETIAVACWYLWWIRRRRTHNETVPPMSHCRMSVLSITANAAKAASRPTPSTKKWVRPNPRQLKVNVDGSFHADVFAGSAGAVLRDFQGRFVAATTTYIPNVASAAAAEAVAMKEGLALANLFGCNDVVAESDSLEVIEACSGQEAWWGDSSAVFADCVDLAAQIGECPLIIVRGKQMKLPMN